MCASGTLSPWKARTAAKTPWGRLLSDIYCLSALIFIYHISHFALLKMLLFMAHFAWGRAIIWMIIYDAEAFLKRKENYIFSVIFFRRKIWSSQGVACFCDVLWYDFDWNLDSGEIVFFLHDVISLRESLRCMRKSGSHDAQSSSLAFYQLV